MAGAQDIFNYAFGRHGATFIRGTDTHAGKWYAIHVVTAAVFHASTAYENSDLSMQAIDGDTLAVTTHAAGTWLFGRFTTIKLASGAVIAYKDSSSTAVTTT